MNKPLLRTVVAATLAAAASLSQAATVNFSGWAYGDSWGNIVNVAGANDPLAKDNGAAGAFTGSVAFTGTENGFSGTINNFLSYCVELTESFYLPSGAMTGYNVVSGNAYGEWTNANGNGRTAAQTATRVGQLLSYADSNGMVQTAAQSTSLQLAIWNVIYDTDNSLNAGIFRDLQVGSAYDGYANTLLSSSLGWGQGYDVYVLTKNASQDFVLTNGSAHALSLNGGGGAVPEPASLALVALGLGAVALTSRRRRA